MLFCANMFVLLHRPQNETTMFFNYFCTETNWNLNTQIYTLLLGILKTRDFWEKEIVVVLYF